MKTKPMSPQNRIATLASLYLQRLGVHNYSPHTIESQNKQLRYFHEFCAGLGIHAPDAVDRALVQRYQLHVYQYRSRAGKPLAAGTQRQWLPSALSYCSPQ